MRLLFLSLAAVGVIVPYIAFVPWVFENGFNVTLFLSEMFQSRIAAFFSLDVIVSALALAIAAIHTHRRGGHGLIATVGATMLIGVSAGLPLYLYFRLQEFRTKSG